MVIVIRGIAKTLRNVISDSVAAVVFHVPAAEGVFLRLGRFAARSPLVNVFFRRSKNTLGERWRASGRQFRRVSIEGVEIVFDCTDFAVNGKVFYDRCYEPDTTRFIRRSLSPGDVFVNIGANKGYYALLAARIVGPTGRVYAIEPSPETRSCLSEHVRRNQVEDRVRVYGEALSSRSGSASFFLSNRAGNSGLSSLTPSAFALETGRLSLDNSITVATETYDKWSERERVGQVDVLLMDVEGGEEDVLEGMAETLKRQPPSVIICETRWDSPAHGALVDRGYAPDALGTRRGVVGNILYRYRAARQSAGGVGGGG